MNDENKNANPTDPLERFLDGQMDVGEVEQFLANYDPEQLEKERALDSELQSSLKRMFARTSEEDELLIELAASTAERIESTEKEPATIGVSSERPWVTKMLGNRLFQVAVAACLLIALTLNWTMFSSSGTGTVFEPRQLASLYKEIQAHGFRPYYNCEDPVRFANTFEKRQGQRLALAEMPEGVRMLGLSYLGGLTPDTTAMLGEVNGEQVIVFVERVSNEELLQSVLESNDTDLKSFVRKERGLVFIEITPHDEPTLINFFEFADQVPKD